MKDLKKEAGHIYFIILFLKNLVPIDLSIQHNQVLHIGE